MALSPKERADFDEIVARLRVEDVGPGLTHPKRRSVAMLLSVFAATLVLGAGVVLTTRNPDAFAPILVAVLVLGGLVLGLRACLRGR